MNSSLKWTLKVGPCHLNSSVVFKSLRQTATYKISLKFVKNYVCFAITKIYEKQINSPSPCQFFFFFNIFLFEYKADNTILNTIYDTILTALLLITFQYNTAGYVTYYTTNYRVTYNTTKLHYLTYKNN